MTKYDVSGLAEAQWAVRAGLDRDYGPMQKVFEEVIARSLRRGERPSVGARGGKA